MKMNGTQSDEELARAGIALGKQMNEPDVSQFGFELLEAIANGEDPQQRRARHVRRLNVYFCRNYPQTALADANLSCGSRVMYRKAHRVLLLAEQHSDQALENLAGDLVETIVGRESMIEQLAAFERISNHDAQWWQSIHAGAEAHSGIKTSTPSPEVIKSSPRKKAALLLLGSVVLLVAAYALFLVFSPVSATARIDREKAENRANTLSKSSIKADDSPDSSNPDHTSTPQVTGIIQSQKPAATPQDETIKHHQQEDTQRGKDGTTMDGREVRKAPVSATARIDGEKAENRANTLSQSSIKAHDSPDSSISDHTSTPQVSDTIQSQKTAATPPDEAIKRNQQEDTQRGKDGTTMDGMEIRKALVSKTARIDREKAEKRINTSIKSSIKAHESPDSSNSDHTSTPQVSGVIHSQKPKTAAPQDEAIKHNQQEDTQRGEDGTTMARKEVRKALAVEVRKAIPAKFKGDFGSW